MTQANRPSNSDIGLFYSHVSRLFNSSVNVLISIIFGWTAFIGLAWSILRVLPDMRLVLLITGFFIFMMALYNLYFRVLQFGRLIYRLENELELRNYIDGLITLPGIGMMVSRKNAEAFTLAEILAIVFLVAYFVATLLILA